MFNISIKDKVAWVTGSSRGIGRASAIALARAGAHVAVSYVRQKAGAEKVVSEISALGNKSMAVKVDVSKREECEAAYEEIKKSLGTVDILVNSAGITADNLFLMSEQADWERLVNTNLNGTINTMKLVIPDMMYKRWGRIINISSAAGTKGGRGQSNYAATKAAIEGMSRSIAVEVAKQGIRVNCIAPGVVETDMSKEVIELAKDEILKRQLVKRFASPDEIAPWVVLLASDYGDFVTGTTIHIDGGLKMP